MLNFRFYTGKNVWSAQLNITKCRVKGGPVEETRTRSGSPSRAGGAGGTASGTPGAREDEEACPLRLSVAARRPPDVLDPKTRYFGPFLQLNGSNDTN